MSPPCVDGPLRGFPSYLEAPRCAEAGDQLRAQESSAPFWSIYEMFNLRLEGWRLTGVMWSAMPTQIPQLLGLFTVVAFGACPDRILSAFEQAI